MMFWNIFTQLCIERGTTPTAVVNQLNISRGSVTHWKNGMVPHHETLSKISDYFSVSVDYLLGKADKKEKSPVANSDEALKVALFGGDTEVTDEMWNEVMNYAEFLKQKYKKT